MSATANDSRFATYEHIDEVKKLLIVVMADLMGRSLEHDASKLESPEKEAYDGLEERLRSHEYGSEGYRAVLREMKPAIKHHYEHNRHHPEHFPNGMRDMNLMDVLEMLCDWKAASLRQPNGSVREYMDHNQERFGFSDDVKALLLNTLDVLEAPIVDDVPQKEVKE